MQRCNPEIANNCPLAQVCDKAGLGAKLARTAITNGLFCAEESQGETCGPLVAYYEAGMCADALRKLDEEHPPTHTVQIIEVPAGEAPDKIRQSLVDIRFRIRATLQPITPEHVAIHPLDFILALDEAGKLLEAQWYREYTARLESTGQVLGAWYFSTEELRVSENVKARPSLAPYALIPYRKAVLGAMWSGFMLPPALFASGPETDFLYRRLKEEADRDYDGIISAAILWKIIAATFENNNLLALLKRGGGRLTTHDEAGEIVEIYDPGGIVVYDRAQGIDHRENPENAIALPPRVRAEYPFVVGVPVPEPITEKMLHR